MDDSFLSAYFIDFCYFINYEITYKFPASILCKSIAGRYRPVRVADGPITARCRFIKDAYWELTYIESLFD